MAVNLSFIGGAGWQFFDDSGDPLSGGKIYTYAAGTTTPLTTYTSRDGITPNANPIILDAAGRTPAQIWSTEGLLYKYVIAKSNDVQIRVWDNIGGTVVASDLSADLANTTDNAKGDALIGFRQSNSAGFLTGATAKTVNNKLQEIVSVKDFGATGDGTTDDTVAVHAALDYAISNTVPLYFPSGEYRVTSGYTNSQAASTLTMFGDERRDGTNVILDSASSTRFFYDFTGGTVQYLTVYGMSFQCAQSVTDTDFFRFTNAGYNNIRFRDVIFYQVNRPIVFKQNTYSDTSEFIGVAFNDSGTIYCDTSATGSLGNIITLIDVSHNGTIPENTAKQVMNLQGFRGLQATNLLLQGNLPSTGWTVLYLDNEYSVDWTQDNVIQVNGFWNEWTVNAPLYAVDQKGGRSLWNNAAFGLEDTASGTKSIIRLRESAQMQINNASFIGNTATDTINNMFSFEDIKCHAVLNRCATRYVSPKSIPNITFVNCSYAADGSTLQEPVRTALFGTQQSAVAFRWTGGYLPTDGGFLTLAGSTTATPSTDATYGRKYVITPNVNTLSAIFYLNTRGFIEVGTQYNIILRCKLPTFTAGSFTLSAMEGATAVAGGSGYDTAFSGQIVTLNINRRLYTAVTEIGVLFSSNTATGVTGDLEVYAVGIYVGNDSPRIEYLQQATTLTTHSTAAPTVGSWAEGDRVFNSAPAVGSPKSWVCTVTGTPGTWRSEGNL